MNQLKFNELEEGKVYLVEDSESPYLFSFTSCIIEDGIMKIQAMTQNGTEWKSVLDIQSTKEHFEKHKDSFTFMWTGR